MFLRIGSRQLSTQLAANFSSKLTVRAEEKIKGKTRRVNKSQNKIIKKIL